MPLVPAGCMQLPRLTSSGPASSHLGSVANLSGLAAFGGLAPVSISQQAARTSSVALLLSPTGSNTATMTALPSMAAMALGLGAGDAGAAPHPSPADASLSGVWMCLVMEASVYYCLHSTLAQRRKCFCLFLSLVPAAASLHIRKGSLA